MAFSEVSVKPPPQEVSLSEVLHFPKEIVLHSAKPWEFTAQDAVNAELKEQLEKLDENCTEGCSIQKYHT